MKGKRLLELLQKLSPVELEKIVVFQEDTRSQGKAEDIKEVGTPIDYGFPYSYPAQIKFYIKW